jgi:two-component system response regulator AdeR
VVDDEPDIADTVEAVLVAEGYRVRKACDGAEALEALKTLRPDLILMDYEMPRMKGTEVCARIRRGKGDRDIPILLATAAMVDLSALADADGFLVKPYQRDVLVSFLAHLVPGPAIRRPPRRTPIRSSDRAAAADEE